MTPTPRRVLLASALLVPCGAVFGQMTPLKELPGMGKARKGGYTITVEGGEEGTRTVHYSGNEKPASNRTSPAAPVPLRGPMPAAPAPEPPESSPERRKGSWEKRIDDASEVESPLNRVTKREDILSERRFDRRGAEHFNPDEKFDSRDPLAYGRWDGAAKSFGKSRAENVDFSDMFETQQVEKKRVFYGTRDREPYSRDGEKADVRGWTERFPNTRNDRFSDPEKGSSLRDRVADGYKLLTQVSMQDINRFQFRRSHSDVKGELPVGKIGGDAPTPMRRAGDE